MVIKEVSSDLTLYVWLVRHHRSSNRSDEKVIRWVIHSKQKCFPHMDENLDTVMSNYSKFFYEDVNDLQ